MMNSDNQVLVYSKVDGKLYNSDHSEYKMNQGAFNPGNVSQPVNDLSDGSTQNNAPLERV